MDALGNLGINLGYLAAQILNFIIVLLILNFWVYKPLVTMLTERREKIAQGLEDARIASEARENAETEAETIANEAQVKASEIVREASTRAEEVTRDIKAAADADASTARADALAEVEKERNRILGEIRGQVAALAIAAAQKLVGEALDEKRQHVLINEFFSGVKSGKVAVMEAADVDGASAIVTSALPLTDDEQQTIKKDVLSKMGGSGDVSFEVDPSIMGGLVVRVGDKVLDGSVSGQLEAMRQSLR